MLLLLAVRLRSGQTLAFVPQHMKQFHNLWCSDNDRQCMWRVLCNCSARHLVAEVQKSIAWRNCSTKWNLPNEKYQIKVYVATFIMYSNFARLWLFLLKPKHVAH
jgi:hypothetical protein